jgi:hypothetical protein
MALTVTNVKQMNAQNSSLFVGWGFEGEGHYEGEI